MLSLFRQKRDRPVPPAPAVLFDEEFQRKLEMLAFVSRRVVAGRQRADRRTTKKGSGIEFADHRNYAVGDDFRFVDWAVYQRFGRLLVRLYEEEEDLSIHFIVDCSASMVFRDRRKFDHARRLCAALAYVGLANLDRVSVVGVDSELGKRLPPTRGKNRIFKVLRFLEQLEPSGATDLRQGLRRFVAQNKRPGLAVLLSDLYDPHGFEEGINMLRYSRFEPFVMHVRDPEDTDVKALGDVQIQDCETRAGMELTLTPDLLRKYAQAIERHDDAIARFCASKHVPYLRANTDVPFDETVLRVFRQGGFLR